MANPKQIDAQRDFTAGEIDPTAKRRDDDEFIRKGLRQSSNVRALNTGGASQRPGRNALQTIVTSGRTEDVLMAPGVRYRLAFTTNTLTIYDATGAQVFTEGGRAWTAATVGQIVYAVYLKQIFITFPGVIPETLSWDGVSTWSSAPFAELLIGNQKRTPFYRIAPQNITLLPSAQTGAITLQTNLAYFVAGMVNTRIRFVGRQILITAVTNSTNATGLVQEALPGSQGLDFGSVDPTKIFAIGDPVRGSISNAEGIVVSFGGGSLGNGMNVQLLTLGTSTISTVFGPLTQAFVGTDVVVNAAGSAPLIGASNIIAPQVGIAVWDEEVMNAFRGWPASVTTDQGRTIFDNFPAVPGGIAWGAIGSPTDLNVGPNPGDGFFEVVPGKGQVLHVLAGPESSEFVFVDNATYYVPISPTNPLKPGSVQFQKLGSDGASAVQPRTVGGVIFYVDQGLNKLMSIVATGAYNRPYESHSVTDLHSHLFNNIQAIALPTSVTQFTERYAYVLNGDGTVAVGKYTFDQSGKVAGPIGWVPWSGAGAVKWISALNDAVLFVTAYTAGATAFMVEQLDATLYLDASFPVNAPPAPLTPPGGKGPLWWLPTATVDLMDGQLPRGPHATDANGFILPNSPGEDLTSATLRAGFTWTAIMEPFIPAAQPGQDAGQRMKKRRVSRFEVYVMQSSGFLFRKLYNGVLGPNLPALGAAVSERRIAAYNMDDNPNLAPPLREQAYAYKPLGRSHDPRVAIVKDTPGPLIVAEISARVSV